MFALRLCCCPRARMSHHDEGAALWSNVFTLLSWLVSPEGVQRCAGAVPLQNVFQLQYVPQCTFSLPVLIVRARVDSIYIRTVIQLLLALLSYPIIPSTFPLYHSGSSLIGGDRIKPRPHEAAAPGAHCAHYAGSASQSASFGQHAILL